MSTSHALSRWPWLSCDGSAPCNDVGSFSWPAFLILAAILFAVLVGPFLAIRAIARDRRRAEEWYIPDRDENDSLHVPPWQGWVASILVYLVYAFCLAVVFLLAPSVVSASPGGGPAELWASLVAGILLMCVALRVVVDIKRWGTNRRALERLAGKLERVGEPRANAEPE